MINFVGQIAEDGLLAKRELNTPAVLHLFRYFIVQGMAEKISGIYQIQSKIKPERIYIGSATDFKTRQATHLCILRKNRHDNGRLQNHFNKYGIDDLVFSVIEECSVELLTQREQYYIDTLKPFFNICLLVGRPLGVKRSKETRRKISEAKRGKPSIFKGTHKSSESKEKQSIIMKGRKQSPETVEKRVSKFRGRKQTDGHIRKRMSSRKKNGGWRKGTIPWNKGLIKETNESMRKVSETLKKRNAEIRKNKL